MPPVGTGIINVREYGAVGDGVSDDTNAIQTAINTALVTGINSSIPPFVGNTIFGAKLVFPAGSYKTTRPLVAKYINGMGIVVLEGQGVVSIYGNFPGYIIDKPDDGSNQLGLVGIEGLSIQNYYGAGGLGSANGTTLTANKPFGNAWKVGMVVVDDKFGGGISYGGAGGCWFNDTVMEVGGNVVVGQFKVGHKIVGPGVPWNLDHIIVAQLTGNPGKHGTYQLNRAVASAQTPLPIRSGPYITAITGQNTYTISTPEHFGPHAVGGGIGTGAMRMCSTGNGYIRGCSFQGVNGLDSQNSTFCETIENCTFTSAPFAGAVGAYGGQVSFKDCNFIGNSRALICGGSTNVMSSRFEINDHGIIFGQDLTGGQASGSYGISAIGNTFESNGISMALTGVNGGIIAGNKATAYPGAVQLPQGGHGDARVGLLVAAASGVVFSGNDFGIYCPGAAIDCSNNGNTVANNVVFQGCRASNGHPMGKAWQMPEGNFASAFSFDNCNNPVFELPWEDLPGNDVYFVAVTGMEYNLKDAQTNLLGANVTGGGGSHHVKVRYNGTNWRVVG